MSSAAVFASILQVTEAGIYCPAGDFYIDPWKPVDLACITHAHSDHARWGSKRYIATTGSAPIMKSRLGDIDILPLPYGVRIKLNHAWVSLHPAGHILGSAQVRIEVDGKVAVVSGDYKREPDPTCEPFELLECDLFVTESTFGLPAFQWPQPERVFTQIDDWWKQNQLAGKTSVLMGYALGKSQRLLAGVDPTIGPIYVHGAVHGPTQIYRNQGILLPDTNVIHQAPADIDWNQALIVAVPSAQGTPWLRRFGNISTAMASGWMAIRGTRRRRAMDRGFVLSDHVDWPSLIQTVLQTKASTVWVTHGFAEITARYLREIGIDAQAINTQFEGEVEEAVANVADDLIDPIAELPS